MWVGKSLIAAVVWMLGPVCFAQGTLAGDWQGALQVGSGTLHIVLHIRNAADGSLSATIDSVEQGAYDIPASAVSLTGSKLSLTLATLHGTYDGTVNASLTEIDGTWTQHSSLPLNFTRVAAVSPGESAAASAAVAASAVPPAASEAAPTAADVEGAWLGTLDLGVMKLRVVFHIASTADGLTATMDSPDQGAKGIPVSAVTLKGDTLTIEAKKIGGVFAGTVASDRSAISGTWTQGGQGMPLVVRRAKDASAIAMPRRPQVPVKPYPYSEVELTYENKVQGDTLAATLTIPQGKGPFPAVLLITGSGAQDRDESLAGHKPFLVLSDYLTRRGIAVLRADDRGTAKSTGDFATATTADFATDAEAGVAYLKTRPEVDAHRIGLIGHSEGGIIAPMVAARNADVAFIVMMAGSGVRGDQILVAQNVLLAEASGVSAEIAEAEAAKKEVVFAQVIADKDKDAATLQKDLHAKLDVDGKSTPAIDAEIDAVTTPWFRYFIAYDPAVALRQVKCPVLALNGEKDLQVPPKQNLPAIRKALEEGGNTHFEVDELPGLNHLFQTATTGSVAEYASIEETMSPVAMEKMAVWVLKQ